MAFTFVQEQFTAATATATTIARALTGVGEGNLIVCWVKHEGAAVGITMQDDLGNALTAATKTSHANGDTHGQFFYRLSAASGNRTYTATFDGGASRPFRSLIVFEHSYENECFFESENGATGTAGSSTTLSSGDFTTTVADAVAFGGYGEYSTRDITVERIGDVAADGVVTVTSNFTVAWRRILAATMTGDADCFIGGSGAWIVRGIAFRDGSAPAGGPPPWSRFNEIPGRKRIFIAGA